MLQVSHQTCISVCLRLSIAGCRAETSLRRLCKDPSKRFCPSCGNATLLRTTVTTSASTGKQHIHLKRYFQYHLRGSKYSIPDAKPGRAKGQQKAGTGLILREDQQEWQNAVRSNDIHRQKEERKLAKGALEGWNDPDVSDRPQKGSWRCADEAVVTGNDYCWHVRQGPFGRAAHASDRTWTEESESKPAEAITRCIVDALTSPC